MVVDVDGELDCHFSRPSAQDRPCGCLISKIINKIQGMHYELATGHLRPALKEGKIHVGLGSHAEAVFLFLTLFLIVS
jgi:hypothetical protein